MLQERSGRNSPRGMPMNLDSLLPPPPGCCQRPPSPTPGGYSSSATRAAGEDPRPQANPADLCWESKCCQKLQGLCHSLPSVVCKDTNAIPSQFTHTICVKGKYIFFHRNVSRLSFLGKGFWKERRLGGPCGWGSSPCGDWVGGGGHR